MLTVSEISKSQTRKNTKMFEGKKNIMLWIFFIKVFKKA